VPRKPKDNVVTVDSEPVEEPDTASTLTELKPKSQRYEDDDRYTQPNPFDPKSPAQNIPVEPASNPILPSDDAPLPTLKEIAEIEQCNKLGISYRDYCDMANVIERMGAARPTPTSIATTLHYTQHPIGQGVEDVGEPLEGDVGSGVGEPLEVSVGEPLEDPDPMQAAKEQVISTVEDFLQKGGKFDIARVGQESSNEWKVVRHAAKVGLSLHWLSLKFKLNKNTKAYKSLEESFTKHGGKVNR
jgi:hypothetical protein